MLGFTIAKELVMACHISGVYDVNRNNTLPDDDFAFVKDWADSLTKLGLQGILFHNNFSEATCLRHQNNSIRFVRVAYDAQYTPNVYRYFVYLDFLYHYGNYIKNLFITDVSDVVAVKNPFNEPLFLENRAGIFCGDETKKLDDAWMKAHSDHFRNQIADYAVYEEKFKESPLLNCGIIGGSIVVMTQLLEELCTLHRTYNRNNNTAYTGDMGAFNYVVRTRFNQKIFHGSPINTRFKAYENERTDCWFRHK